MHMVVSLCQVQLTHLSLLDAKCNWHGAFILDVGRVSFNKGVYKFRAFSNTTSL